MTETPTTVPHAPLRATLPMNTAALRSALTVLGLCATVALAGVAVVVAALILPVALVAQRVAGDDPRRTRHGWQPVPA